MLAARDVRAQFDEAGMLSKMLLEINAKLEYVGLSRDDRQALLVWLDDYQETGNKLAPLARIYGKTVRVGDQWGEELIQKIKRWGWEMVDLHQKRPFPNKVREMMQATKCPAENVQRLVRVDSVVLEQRALRCREFKVHASGAWWVDGVKVQATTVTRGLANFVMSFGRREI